ncbi:MAG: tetratricopeptide repeat protein [Polyangiaceae bacterium]|nr:tetratricopeptide repeat protein [Polyangiaceae bacterium]
MDSRTIRTALGLLQDDPENEGGWTSLRAAAEVAEGDLSLAEGLHLFASAREQYRERGEWDGVASLLEISAAVATPEERPALLLELAKVYGEEHLDEVSAREALEIVQRLLPEDPTVAAAVEDSLERGVKWKELVSTYAAEADGAPDDVYRSSMLMRAAEVAVRFGGEAADTRTAIDQLEQAVRLDTNNDRAVRLLERLYRQVGAWEDAARVLERAADCAEDPRARFAAGRRLARLYLRKLEDQERCIRAYQRVLKDAPEDREAKAFLSELFSREERWEELVRLYEREIDRDTSGRDRLGDMVQIAMLHWRKLGRQQEAEQWFERVRKLEPAHPGALAFFRDYLSGLGDDARLVGVLQAAQRAVPAEDEKARLGTEIGRLSEGLQNAQKAIEQYKSVLRHDPDNVDAREALKRLYKQTEGYNALVELLRQQLERTDPNDYPRRLGILREVAGVYRTYLKSDTALVSVLNQIVQLDEKVDAEDVEELRELVQLYQKLGRWRDLLTWQLKLAEVTPDLGEKKALYRAAGERWLEQFTNVQNATEAYERLLELAPDDADARRKLEELYRKRRAWPALYQLFEGDLAQQTGSSRVSVLKEMAQLAAERLNRGEDAVRLYKQILDEDPSRTEVLDVLEKHAERARDWPTLADALERRIALVDDGKDRLAVLQKLGAVYAEHLGDAPAAARTWRRVLELQPGHHRALRVLRDGCLEAGDYSGLEELYASQDDFEGLADVLSNAADRAKDAATKIDLSYRAAAVYENQLGAPDRAFRSYERVLQTNPADARAARALIPLYERDEKWARLPPLYEVLVSQTDDPDAQLALLQKLVEVTGSRLSDRRAAVGFARRAYEVAPTLALPVLEETVRLAGAWDVLVECIAARLAQGQSVLPPSPERSEEEEPKAGKKRKPRKGEAAVGDATAEVVDAGRARIESPSGAGGPAPDERRRLHLRLAELYADELGRSGDAVSTYQKLLERDPTDIEAANALETILRREDRRDDLRWLLDLRVEHAPDDEVRVRVLGEWAALEEDAFEANDRAAVLYARVLDLDPGDRVALRALPRLLLGAGDVEGAVAVIERDRDRAEADERAEREIELAQLYLDRLERPLDALEAAVRALDIRGSEPRAIDVLERTLDLPVTQARAAAVLADVYAASGDARRQVRALEVMLRHAGERSERLELVERLASVNEERLESYSAALEVVLRALREYPTELPLWDRAEALAARAGRPTDLAETLREVLRGDLGHELVINLSERAARLHEERLGDPTGAIPYLEKVLALDPSNDPAFKRLKDILTAAERWSELEALYDRSSEATDDSARRVEMLTEVALICDEIIEDGTKARRYYERILEIDPLNEPAVRALDRLYAAQGQDAALAKLIERRLETAVGEERIELELRLARIQLEKLLEPAAAAGHVEHVLAEQPQDYAARDLAEKLLEIGSLRGRAARMLERVYEQRDGTRDLVRVLAIRLEELEADLERAPDDGDQLEERRGLLRRIAILRDDRLHDDEGAFEVLTRLVPQDPGDSDARQRLLEIGRRIGAHGRVADVLAVAAERTDASIVKGEILMRVAAIYADLLGDVEGAEATYRRVLTLDEDDPDLVLPAARALEAIYAAAGRHADLAAILRIQVNLERDGALRSRLLGRLGDLCQTELGDNAGAIAAWRTRLEDDPQDTVALAALDALYERTEAWADLVAILERRRDATSDAGERRVLMTRMATILGSRLESTSDAITAWRAVIDEFGSDESSLRAMESLLSSAGRWDELPDIYERHLQIVETYADRLDLLVEIGNLRRNHLNDVPGALDAYRNALTLDASHQRSREAMERLLDGDDHITRREAAEVLHPIYEADGNHRQLLHVLEIEVDATDDSEARLAGLAKAMNVAEGALGDPARAFGFAQQALRVALGREELGPWLAHVERLAAATDQQAAQVALLREVIPDIFEGDVQVEVIMKVADLARNRLGDRELAREYYGKVLELRADDPRALVALESLFEESGNAAELLGVLERRAEVATSDSERKELLFRRARLLADAIGDRLRAIEVYEAILDMGMDPVAVSALEDLYQAEERWSDLIALYERMVEAGTRQPADLRVKIANVAARKQNDIGRAFEELERALELERQHAEAIVALEGLLADATEAEHRARAAALLEPVYLIRADYDRVMVTLRARREVASDPAERRDLLNRLAQLYEEQKEDYVAALDTTAELLDDDLSDAAAIAELERLAKVAGAERRLAEIYARVIGGLSSDDEASARLARRTGEIFAGIGELERALEYLRRALAFEPENDELFGAVDALLERAERHEERVDLYRSALDHRYDPTTRSGLLHTIASLQRQRLGRPDDAIDTYRAALDVDDTDAAALDALTELFRDRGRWSDLADLYLRRAEAADDDRRAAAFRIALARLFRDELSDVDRAIDQLEEIVRRTPEHGEAIKELEGMLPDPGQKERVVDILRPLYESQDNWRHTIRLNEERYALAETPADRVVVLRETATLWETRGNDPERACRAVRAAVALDPDDAETRAELERLTASTGGWSALAAAYEEILQQQPDLASRRDVLAVLAATTDERLDDPRRALLAYERLHEADVTELEPLEKMERLAMLLSDWRALVKALVAKADLLLGDAERAATWRQIGEARRDMLEDAPGAIEAYERAFDLESDRAFTVDCLIDLYEAKGDASRLVELYQRRVELCEDDDELRYDLLLRSAQVFEESMSDRPRAIDVLTQALAIRPADRPVLAALNRLYRAEEMWPELLENLRIEAGTAEAVVDRAGFRRDMGKVLDEKLASFDEAVEAYRSVLEEVPDDAESIAAVRAMGAAHEELREVVAAVLVPVLRSGQRYAELVDVLELRLSVETDPVQRSETLCSIAEVLESRLGDPSAALGAMLRGMAERPEEDAIHRDVERLAAAVDGWAMAADALAARAQSAFDPSLLKDLYLRLGRIAEEHLRDDPRAITAYVHAVEQAGDDPELLAALDRLYERTGDRRALADVLERRAGVVNDPSAEAELLYRLAILQIGDFGDSTQGLGSLRAALERDPAHENATEELEKLTSQRELFEEAVEVLEQVYRTRGRTERLVALYGKRVDFAESSVERIETRRSLARVLEDDARDPVRAQRVLEAALQDDPGDSALLEEIERLAPITGDWAGPAVVLRSAVDGAGDLAADVARELLVRCAGWLRDRAGDRAGAESVLARALAYDSTSDEVLAQIEELQRDPGRERDLVATLRQRAALQVDDVKREELHRQAKDLADRLGDAELGEQILRDLVAHDDVNVWALSELTRLREAAGDYAETFALLLRRSELPASAEIVKDLQHQAAAIARDRLDRKDQAAELFATLFEDDPFDRLAADALQTLYSEAERWDDLVRLIERLVDLADTPAARSALRIELARLNAEHFQSYDTSINLLRDVLDEEPGHPEAVVVLSQFLEKTDRDEELAELLESQIGAARERRESGAEVRFLLRLADVCEGRLRDRERAIGTLRQVLECESRNQAALGALGRLHQAVGQYAEAAAVLEQLVEVADRAAIVGLASTLADVYEKLDDRAAAARALERAVDVDPGNDGIRRRLRALYTATESWEQLADMIARDADLASEVGEKVALLRQAADIHAARRSDVAASARVLEKASELCPDDRSLLLQLCDAYSASGRGSEAARVLERVVESFGTKRTKELADIHRRLADAYLADGDSTRALSELDKAFRIEPGNINVLLKLGDVAFDTGDLKKAQQMFRALLLQRLDQGPITKAEVFYKIGETHLRLDEKPKAKQHFERALQADPNHAASRARIEELKG